jgi:hypothetical protein
MKLASALLLAFTAAMVLVHLTSGRLLRKAWAGQAPGWLSVLNIFRFEGIYYLALMVYVAWQRGRFLLLPLLVMAALHMAGWAMAERRREWLTETGGKAVRARILVGVQAFDLAETVVLVYIAGVLRRVLFSPR